MSQKGYTLLKQKYFQLFREIWFKTEKLNDFFETT